MMLDTLKNLSPLDNPMFGLFDELRIASNGWEHTVTVQFHCAPGVDVNQALDGFAMRLAKLIKAEERPPQCELDLNAHAD